MFFQKVGSVYILKNFQVKTSNRAFNSLPHDYELSMGNETQIIPYTDDTSRIPTATYNFAEIAKVEELEKDTIVGEPFGIRFNEPLRVIRLN